MRGLLGLVLVLVLSRPAAGWAQEFTRTGDALHFINQEISRPNWDRELSLAKDAGGNLLVLKSQRIGNKDFNYVYRVRADMLDPKPAQWLPDGTVMLLCKNSSRCVESTDAATNQHILSFEYLTIGPFPNDAESRMRAEEAIRCILRTAN